MIQPQFELLPDDSDDAETRLLEVGRITPVYESLGGARLASRWQRKTIFHLLEGMRGAVPECLPAAMLERLELPDRETALREVHFPSEGTPMVQLQAAATPAHRRLIFEELFFLELGLELKRRRMRERAGIGFATNEKVREAIREVLPFHPTAAQKRTLARLWPTCAPRARCGGCCKGMWARARRLWRCRRCWWRWKRLPGGVDGAYRDSGYTALSGDAQAAGAVEPAIPDCIADWLAL